MEFTEEMLEILEKVKGKRNIALWDSRCESALSRKKVQKVDKKQKKG